MVLKIEVHESAIKGANRCNIPTTLEKSKISKQSDNLWMDFSKKVWMPLKISDKGSIKIIQGVKLKLRIDWKDTKTGASSSAEIQTKCDKSGLYWFASILMYVSGNVKLTIETVPLEIDGKKIKSIERSYVIEGDNNDEFHAHAVNNNSINSDNTTKGGRKKSILSIGDSKLLTNENALKRMITSTTEITGEILSLDLSETHCKMIFDDHLNIKIQETMKKKSKQKRNTSNSGNVNLSNISSQVYVTASDVLNRAEKSAQLDTASSEDIFNKIRSAYEVFFESKLLYNSEKSFYEEIVNQAREENVPIAEVTDDIFLLRLLIFLCINTNHEEEVVVGLEEEKESKPRPRGRPRKESKEKEKEKEKEVTSPSAKRRKVVQNKTKGSIYNIKKAVAAILKEIEGTSITL